ncbi:MAG: alanine--tRNA ligase [Bacteroidetes bacterium]|nr:alanine--tRNA ligase [Bacteroidota bacterium]
MKSGDVRQKFLEFFKSKQHKIVPSAPLVVKNDPTLMFTNAGMNQFKDYFLGNSNPISPRIANTQKCLRVSGKHNDLEEVGHDTYHHTLFEMLGNWSFGDADRPEKGYFKKEAIEWAWELLTDIYKIDKDLLYASYFGGDEKDGLEPDLDTLNFWKKVLPEERILPGSKKDNFWEMGDSGPCGPCSEIHVDLRPEKERKRLAGKELVNKDHPLVVEIWNLVFIQFNRLADGNLQKLPSKHVDTGMGLERLCMTLQGVSSNYDTDIFQPIIQKAAAIAGIKYGENEKNDIALRVVSDHLRAVAFSIADGQLPSNNKSGYVIRRILRRAVRYAFTFLGQKEAFLFKLIPTLTKVMGDQFPELISQQQLVKKVIQEEEVGFLRTLDTGIRLLNEVIKNCKKENLKVVSGKNAFELYDTFGFPIDLTELILRENKLEVDLEEFKSELLKQKERSRSATSIETDDWKIVRDADTVTEFIGYDHLEARVKIVRHRKIISNKKEFYQLVFDKTPFYAESGGQVGDTGFIEAHGSSYAVLDTQKENDLLVHILEKLPEKLDAEFKAVVNSSLRMKTIKNHSATHLLHQGLRGILGKHVEQKGSLVEADRLRFDFSHFQKLSDEELSRIELFVNEKIMANYPLQEKRKLSLDRAVEEGALALFGEKYEGEVRTIRFGDSIELCGGTHVQATGEIGLFKIISESAIAAGIRRVEAVTGPKAIAWMQDSESLLNAINKSLNVSPKNTMKAVNSLIEENKKLQKELENLNMEKVVSLRKTLIQDAEIVKGVKIITKRIDNESTESIKDLVFEINKNSKNTISLLGARFGDKANLWLMISSNLVDEKGLNAQEIIRFIGKDINGGGGGQAFYATAGGKNPDGLETALQKGREFILSKL